MDSLPPPPLPSAETLRAIWARPEMTMRDAFALAQTCSEARVRVDEVLWAPHHALGVGKSFDDVHRTVWARAVAAAGDDGDFVISIPGCMDVCFDRDANAFFDGGNHEVALAVGVNSGTFFNQVLAPVLRLHGNVVLEMPARRLE